MQKNTEQPKYLKIAVDIANRIISGNLKEGSKVSGRSTLAGEYNVSPETIRRAISMLKDMGVVVPCQKTGIRIESKENAALVIQRFEKQRSLSYLRDEIRELVSEKNNIEKQIQSNINEVIEYATQLKYTGLIFPFEIIISNGSSLVGKTISESKFWYNTGATIVGVKRNEKVYFSPGPYFCFEERDVILYVDMDGSPKRTEDFIRDSY